MTPARVLLLVPHPDDEVVGCAAAIGRARAAGTRFFALYLTTGVPARELLWPWQRASHAARVETRRREALAAAGALGVEPVGFADRPTRRLKERLAEAAREIEEARRRTDADAVWVPAWEGGHQDHDVANWLAARLRARDGGRTPVTEFAEYNYAGGRVRSQSFPSITGEETVLNLTAEEARTKRRLLAIYASERGNLAHVRTEAESLRPLPRHDYAAPPHPGRLFRERFHWVPFAHPGIDAEPSARVRAALREPLPAERMS